MPTIFLTSGTSWAGVATDGSDILIECIGGGGNGSASAGGSVGAGGGGGAYARKTVPYVSGATVTGIQIGAGLDTKWDGTVVVAKAGTSASGGTAGVGGAAASCTPTTGAFSGGAGVNSAFVNNGGGGGGGAAGPNGAGKAGGKGGNGSQSGSSGGGAGGGSSTAGAEGASQLSSGANGGTAQDGTAGGAGSATAANSSAGGAGSHGSGGGGSGYSGTAAGSTGNGGAGGAGVEWDSTHGAGGGGGASGGRNGGAAITTGAGGNGGLYGGGGGGSGWQSGGTFGAAGSGAAGIIAITYTATTILSPDGIASDEAFGTPAITPGVATVSPDGIASAEAFGSLTITPGAVTVSPSSIASAEAFGTLSIGEPPTIEPDGIASAEAFGTPSIASTVTVSPTGIASAEAVGTPRVIQSEASRLLISGVDRTAYLHHESDFSWNLMKGARGSCSLPLIIEPGDAFAPQAGELIEIFDPVGARVWAGTVEQVYCRWFGNKGNHLFVLTGVTLESLFDTAEVDKTHFNAVSGGSAFSDLYTASGVTLVTLGTVDAGVTISGLEVTRIADGFSSIALRSNLIWFVDPADMTLNLISPTARAAPWTMTEDEILWETAQWRQSRADFRDTVVVQAPDGSSQTVIAVTANESIGRRTLRLTYTTSNTSAGAIQEATAVLKRFSTLPSQLVVSTDRPGVSLGMLLELDVVLPIEADGLLNGFWQVIEVEARLLTGMDRVDPALRRLPDDLYLGHFRYTLHLVNSLATAIFQGDGSTTVFTLPVTPGSVSSIRVSPNGGLYATSSLGAAVTVTPAMPDGTHAVVQYTGDGNPDAGNFLDTWKGMSPVAASAGPASSGGGGTAQKYIADSTLRDLTVDDDVCPHGIVYATGTGSRVLAVLRQVLGADLVVRINLAGNELLTITIDASTAVDDVLEFDMSARAFTVTIASPGVVSVAGASFADGDAVVVHTTGALPTGLVAETTYYVVNTAGATFNLAATLGGSAINTSGSQSGKHWLTSSAGLAPAFTDKDVLTLDILASDGTIDPTPGGIANVTVEWE